ncbi:LysR family transcriptional regulator [Ramlibacter sp. Leaf400]|uniref:LysR family transcriptional regulator n=1 Tax=Ramlibacter sp. Leaf400 TaxID=1736365 RepID=UPI0006FAE65D|nr:LysR family transcriptional regulator [Ramlibacter sp. Leaf400]KQT11234.1 LysR family transcriptional regulator [Ramlibacter sp. Leaf400]
MRFLTIRYFHEVAKLGSVRRAADRLHVAPSAVSRQIAQLEDEFDAVLFERSKLGVQLTAAGEVLHRETRRIFQDLERARVALDDLRGLRRGEITIWVLEGLVSDFLPRIIAEFNRRYPDVSFNVQTAPTDRIVEALLEDWTDIGVTFNAAPRAEIEVVGEFIEPISCLVAKSHPYARRKSLRMVDICKQPLALPEHSFGLRQVFDRAVRKYGYEPKVVVTTNSLELTKTMAVTGQVIAFMPALNVTHEVEMGALLLVPVDEPDFAAARSAVCVHRDRPLPHAARAFLSLLTDEIAVAGKNVKKRRA